MSSGSATLRAMVPGGPIGTGWPVRNRCILPTTSGHSDRGRMSAGGKTWHAVPQSARAPASDAALVRAAPRLRFWSAVVTAESTTRPTSPATAVPRRERAILSTLSLTAPFHDFHVGVHRHVGEDLADAACRPPDLD